MKATAIGRRIVSMLTVPVLLIIGFVLLGATAYGQASSNITGVVSDPTGAVVPNAKITITNMDNGFVRVTTSNSTGNYSARDLQIGRYQIQAEAQGFKTFLKKDLTLDVGETARVDATLQVGAVGQTVTVEAAALQVQSETNDVSTTISANQIENLGTNGRNIKQLAALVPGASSQMPDFDSPGAQFQSTSINFNGMRADGNNWVIDGGEAYDRGGGGIFVVAPSEDALAEFTIQTSNFSADQGNSSGGMTTMAVKSGTKRFHAGAWEYNRNDALDAWDYYQKQSYASNPRKPELRYNAFGFNGGGPVEFRSSKPKTFFFYNQEWRREINGGGIHNKVLTSAQLGGDESAFLTNGTPYEIFAPLVTSSSPLYAKIIAAGLQPGQQFPNNVIPASMIDSNTAAYIKAGYFLPPNDSTGTYYNSSANQATDFREEIVRIDHQFSDKYSLFGHLIYESLSQSAATVSWTGNTFPTIGSLETVPSWTGVVHFTANFTPHLLNEIAYNENGNDITIANTGPLVKAPSGWSPVTLFGSAANTANKIPDINMGGGPVSESMDSSNWPWQNWWRSNQIKDDLSYVHGTHNFKAGFAWLWTTKKQQLFANTAGSLGFYGGATGCSTSADPTYCPTSSSINVNGMGIADFLLGAASSYGQSQLQDFVNIHFSTPDAYFLDDWRVSHKLTLNLGIRWEGLPHAYDAAGRASNFYPALFQAGQAATFQYIPTGNATITGNPLVDYPYATNALCTNTTAAGCANANLSSFKTGSSLGVTLAGDTFYMDGVGLAGKNGIPKGLISPHYYNFGPRVGFAYDVFGNQKTILRGGAGAFFERNAGNEEYNMGSDLPFSNNGSSNNAYLDNLSQSYLNGNILPPAAVSPQGFTGLQTGEPISDIYHWSLGIQHQLQGNMIASLGYVGNASAHLSDTVDINTMRASNTATRTLVCGGYCGAGNIPTNNIFRPYAGWSGINLLGDEENSHYGSLQATLRTSEWHRTNLGVAYTYGHTWDGIDGQIWNNISDPLNPKYDKGTAGFDRRQVLAVNFDYTLPNFGMTGIAKTALAGWTIAGIGNVETGLPANVGNNGDPTGCGGDCSSRANQSGPVSYVKTKSVINSQYKWVDLSPFSSAAPLTFGNAGKNSIKGIGRDDWNLSVRKDFKFTESASFSFVAECFNFLNHTQFSGFDTGYQGSTPGQVNGIQGNSFRTFQLGARASF